MLIPLLTGFILIVICVLVQAFAYALWMKYTCRFLDHSKDLSPYHLLLVLTKSVLYLSILHAFQTLIWAIGYYLNPITCLKFKNFTESIYFSLVTFTTLGYGDITLNSEWRILSGLEGINGIMLIGCSTAMIFSLMEQIFLLHNKCKM